MTELLKRTVRNWCKQYFVKNRPKILVIEEIDAIATDIDEAKQAIIELEHRLEEITSHLREKVENEEQLTQAASYIYFTIPEVSTVWLTKGTDGRTNARYLWKFLRPINGFHCPACNSEIEISNRDFLYKAIQGRLETSSTPQYFCKVCKSKQNEIWTATFEATRADEQRRIQARLERIHELRYMPYEQYLQTPEWRERRTRHLESAGHACQICNARNVQLNVHHRTYERRGAELYQDLIVLCRSCHELFHRFGKLAKYFH